MASSSKNWNIVLWTRVCRKRETTSICMKRSVVRQWNITVTGYDFWIIQCVVLYSVRDIACPRHFHLTEGEDKKYPQNKQQQPEMDERKNRMWMRACATRFLCNYRIISSQGFIFFSWEKASLSTLHPYVVFWLKNVLQASFPSSNLPAQFLVTWKCN